MLDYSVLFHLSTNSTVWNGFSVPVLILIEIIINSATHTQHPAGGPLFSTQPFDWNMA